MHYNTFDNLNYNLLTGCSYYLIHDSDPTSGFDVIINNDPAINYNTTVKRSIEIIVDGKKVFLGQKLNNMFLVTVDGKLVQFPYDGVPKIREVRIYKRIYDQ